MDAQKICVDCKQPKILEDLVSYFRRDQWRYRNLCKNCKKIRDQNYYLKNKEKIDKQQKEYDANNKDNRVIFHRKYYQKNKKELLAYQSDYNQKEEVKLRRKEYQKSFEEKTGYYSNYRKENKKRMRRVISVYCKKKRDSDPNFRLRELVSRSIWGALKLNGGSKAGNSFTKHFSYSIDDLKLHLESLFEPWMNWGNQGRYNLKIWDDDDPTTWTWQLDHIVPQSTFDYKSMEEQSFRDCWSLNNLRPLSAKQNYLDGISRIRHKK
jgi:hypothetical protein